MMCHHTSSTTEGNRLVCTVCGASGHRLRSPQPWPERSASTQAAAAPATPRPADRPRRYRDPNAPPDHPAVRGTKG